MTDTPAPVPAIPANSPPELAGGGASLDGTYQRRVTADAGASAVDGLMSKYGKFLAEPASPAGPAAAPAAPAAAGPADRLLQKYGPQAATAASAVPPTPGEAKPGQTAAGRVPLGSTVGGMVGATAHDVLKGILVEAPRATWRGINDAVNSFGDALTEPFGIDLYKMDEASAKALGVDPSWFLSKIAAPETYTGAGIEHVAQFVAGMVPVAKALQSVGLAATVGRPLAAAAAGAIGNMLSSPSHSGNLSNLIESVPALRNPVTGWLASDPGDSVAEGKLKQGLEGAGFGAAAEGVLGALKVYREARDLKGALPEAAVSKAEGAAAPPAEAAAPAVTERDWLQLGGKPEAPLFATATETAQASAAKLIQANTPDEFSAMLDQLRRPTTIQKPQGLLSWLQRQGGVVDAGGDLRSFDLQRTRPGLINKRGMSLDDAALAAQEEGFIGEAKNAGSGEVPRATINDLIDAIHDESRGSPVYRRDDPLPGNVDRLNELQGRLNQLGLDPKTASNEEIGRALEEHAAAAGGQPDGVTPHPDTLGLPDVIRERVPVGAPDRGELAKARAQYPQAIEETTKPVKLRDLDAEPGQLRNYVIMPDGAIREAPMAHAAIIETAMRRAGLETHPDMAGDSMMEELAAGGRVVHFRLTGESGGGLGGGVDIFGDLTPAQKSVVDRLRKMTADGGLSISSWSRPRVGGPDVAPSLAAGRQLAGAEAEGLDLHEQPAQTLDDIARETGDPGYAAAAGEGPGRIRLGPDKIGNINLNRISGEADIREVVRQVAGELDSVTGTLTTRRRGWGVEQASADRMLRDDFIVRRLATGQGSGTAFTASEARATQLIINNLGQNAKALAAKIAGGQATDLDKAALIKLGTQMEGWLNVRSGAMREAGRALAIGRMMGETSKSAETALRGLMAQGATAERMAAVLNGLDKPEQVEAFFKGGWWKKAGDAAFESFMGGILSNPWTHARNFLGNSMSLMWAIPERAAGALVSKTVGDGDVALGEAPAMAYGMVHGFGDALRAAGAAFVNGVGQDAKAELKTGGRAISAARLGIGEQSWYGRAIDFYGSWVNGWAFRALGSADEFASTLARRTQLNALAYRQATQGGGAIEEVAARMKTLLDAPPPEMVDQADAFARNLILRDPLGPIANYFAGARKETPFARYVVPFIQTPANAFKYRLARSPLALGTPRFWSDLSAGGATRDMAVAKLGLGSLVGATTAGWVAQGYVTGAGPQDPATRAAWEREGRLPYAVKIGDRWVQYSQTDPLGLTLGIMADTAHMLDAAEDVKGLASDPKRLDEAYKRLIAAGLKPEEANAATQRAEAAMSQGLNNLPGMLVQSLLYNVVNQSTLSGLSQIAEGIYGDTGKTTGEKLTGQLRDTFLSTVVPQSGALRWAERITDPEMREAKGTIEALKAMVPGASAGLPPLPDLWGEPRVSALARSPYGTRVEGGHPIDKEMDRLGHAAAMPDKAVYGVTLTPSEYVEYTRLAGDGLRAVGGLTARELLDAMVTGDARNPAAAALARQYHDPRLATDGPDGTRAAMIDKVVGGYRQAAQAEMLKRHPGLRIMAEAQKLAGADARTGAGVQPATAPAMPTLGLAR